MITKKQRSYIFSDDDDYCYFYNNEYIIADPSTKELSWMVELAENSRFKLIFIDLLYELNYVSESV